MSLTYVIMIMAVICGPILAVQTQKFLEEWKDKQRRQEDLFKTLMATRGSPLHQEHVSALNSIDLEFSDKIEKEKRVVSSWQVYLDHLNTGPRDPDDPNFQMKIEAWHTQTQQYLNQLLLSMSNALGYDFDEVRVKRAFYKPQLYIDWEAQESQLKHNLMELLSDKRSLPVTIKLIEGQGTVSEKQPTRSKTKSGEGPKGITK